LLSEKERFEQRVADYDARLRINENFDLIKHEFEMGGKSACLYCVDGMTKDEDVQKLMEFFLSLEKKEIPKGAEALVKRVLPYAEVTLYSSLEAAVIGILKGVPCLVMEGYEQDVAIDARTYPARSISEPDKDKVMRGSRDGFVETLSFNTALIRRRIRDPRLTMLYLEAGTVSHTDIVLCYMEDRVDRQYLAEVRQRIEGLMVESLTMNQQSLAECLFRGKWYNPFPKFKYSERPDTAAACILEGDIVVLVDNSPAAMILPTTIFDIIEEADDYYFPPITGTYLRFSRFFASLVALFLTPLYLLLMQHPEWLSERWQFLAMQGDMNIPLIWQFLLMEIALDGLRLASLNTPGMISMPLSVIAGVVIGDYTIDSGWLNSEALLYMALVAIANYTQVSLELGYALKFLRLLLLLLTQWFGTAGFVIGVFLDVLAILFNRTIAGRSYLYPLVPLRPKQLLQRVFRVALPRSESYKRGK